MIGVIIPVYKVEQYLHRCVDSVLSQTCQDFRIVLVDDGSPDGSPAICDAYGEKDSRIQVIHQKNRGLSGARNTGIDCLMEEKECQWLTFLDSDDWLHPQTLERMLAGAEAFGNSICVCGFARTEGAWPEISARQLEPTDWSGADFYGEYYLNATIACGKLFRKECFAAHRFPEGKLNEDEFLTYQLLMEQERLTWIPAPLYCYYRNPDSITESTWMPRRLDVLEALEQQVAYFEARNCGRLADDCMHRYLRNVYGQMRELEQTACPERYEDYHKLLRKKLPGLIRENWRRGRLDFESDYGILLECYPVHTLAYLYCRAAYRRLRRIFSKTDPNRKGRE